MILGPYGLVMHDFNFPVGSWDRTAAAIQPRQVVHIPMSGAISGGKSIICME